MDNIKRLRDRDDAARIAFLQDGMSDTDESKASDSDVDLVSLGAVSYEPIWIFYRSTTPQTRLSGLKGQRIAVGSPGSGLQVLALQYTLWGCHTAPWAWPASCPPVTCTC